MIYLFYPRGIRIVGLPPLKRFDYSRKQASSKHEKLGTSTRGITVRREERNFSLPFPFPSFLRVHHFRSEREADRGA